MKVGPNSSFPFQVPGINDNLTSAISSQSEQVSGKNKEEYTVPELMDKLNKKLSDMGTHIQVKLHEKTNTIMVTVVENETNKVIREIPPEKLLDMVYNMCLQVGVFVDEKM
ncbi:MULTISPECIES: flagellar protein FlaG [Paenibacillus]|uniref:Flagellar protein FlaG protein n=2 Tax=Paenibacillus lactis TaxID=228574 RepID=G4HMD0_9BACL|nr:flagellar protein FlaG [Paenibacillus lactis]EHB54682.1 flagellar protein FlaG protein [Paenibacillus lactis 154]MBP1891018.1 flagellar protein FlaG [Paenibacillus lactis]HAF99075.1 flagellar protein [Paenibacillus lactis]